MLGGKYKITQTIGRGRFGKVVIAERNDGLKVAIKIIPLDRLEDYGQDVQNPIKIYLEGQKKCMNKLNSPYLVKLLNIQQDEYKVYLIFQYCNVGNLRDLIVEKKKQFNLKDAKEYTSQIIIGLQQLHKQNYLHQDIKPENILFHNDNNKIIVKISDFGFSIKDKYQNEAENYAFMAPQIYLLNEFGYPVDIWAVGVAFYYMLNGKFPFQQQLFKGANPTQIMQICQNFDYTKMKYKSDANLIDFFQNIFKFYPEERMDFNEIKQHQLFKEYFQNEQLLMQSQDLYNTKFVSQKFFSVKPKFTKLKVIQEEEGEPVKQKQKEKQKIIQPPISPIKIIKKPSNMTIKTFPHEKNLFIYEINKINFLKETIKYLSNINAQLQYRASLLILRNYLIQLWKLNSKLQSKEKNSHIKDQKIPAQFFESLECKEVRAKIMNLIQQGNTLYQSFNNKNMQNLETVYPGIRQNLLYNLPLDHSRLFKFSVFNRKILEGVQNSLMEMIKKNSNLIQNILKLILRIVISRQINSFFDKDRIDTVLEHYFNWNVIVYGQPVEYSINFDFERFKIWLDNQDKTLLKQTLVLICDKFKKISF